MTQAYSEKEIRVLLSGVELKTLELLCKAMLSRDPHPAHKQRVVVHHVLEWHNIELLLKLLGTDRVQCF